MWSTLNLSSGRVTSFPTTSSEYRSRVGEGALWSGKPQVSRDDDSIQNVALFGTVLAGIHGAGYIRIRDKRLYDYYVTGLRAFEEYSPADLGGLYVGGCLTGKYGHISLSEYYAPSKAFQQNRNILKLRKNACIIDGGVCVSTCEYTREVCPLSRIN